MDIFSYLTVPFAFIMQVCYKLFNNYALALIGYALLAKIVLFPISMKQQKSQLKMVRLRPYQNELAKKYGNNKERYNQELQKLYQREGVNPMGSCLPLLIQLPLIYLIYNIVRHPLTYIYYGVNFTKDTAKHVYDLAIDSIASLNSTSAAEVTNKILTEKAVNFENDFSAGVEKALVSITESINNGAASYGSISAHEMEIYAKGTEANLVNINGDTFFGLFSFSDTPSQGGLLSWMIIIPLLAAATGFLTSWFSQKLNASTQDPAMQGGCSGKTMLYMMPIISLFICWNFNCALGWYWIATNVLSMGQTYILHKMYNPNKALAEVEAKMQKEKEQKKQKRSAAASKKAAAIAASKKKK